MMLDFTMPLMKTKVRLIEKNSGTVLFECEPEQVDLAYEKAADFEQMGLDVKIEQPTVNQTLADSLGVQGVALNDYQDSVAEEIEDHDGSCCYDLNGEKIVH